MNLPMDPDDGIDVTRYLLPRNDFEVDQYELPHEQQEADLIGQNFRAGKDKDDDDGGLMVFRKPAPVQKPSQPTNERPKRLGTFQSMGLDVPLLKAISRKGFSVPTPIQRKAIPAILDNQDVVGMARTGSGKTAAFLIPMIQKLKVHSAQVGARAVILSPSRELAIQTLKVLKELGRGTTLKMVLLVGGDSLEDDFSAMMTNPDIIIATPGRFLHLKLEMKLDLFSVQYVVFDEADRLFELGFSNQLGEILNALPSSRQTLLFSATLPRSLIEFARAGLQDPQLLRLDVESKVSPDLCSAFFLVKSAEKDGALLHLLQDIIKMPTGQTVQVVPANAASHVERNLNFSQESPSNHSTLIFVPTKHHVEYLAALLRAQGYGVCLVYGSLDQTARKLNIESFRSGRTNILIVTDVAARGIDIPILANVINYGFPSQPKIFVHRVGRTARAGKPGWSYSLISENDIPYLLDLQLFLGRELVIGGKKKEFSCAKDVVLGCLVRDKVEYHCEVAERLFDIDAELATLRDVAAKGEKLYIKSRNNASIESARRAKDLNKDKPKLTQLHPLFCSSGCNDGGERESMLTRMGKFRPQETIFEIGNRGIKDHMVEGIRKRRRMITMRNNKDNDRWRTADHPAPTEMPAHPDDAVTVDITKVKKESISESPEIDYQLSMRQDSKGSGTEEPDSWHDSENFISYLPKSINLEEEQRYGVHSGSGACSKGNASFYEAARHVTLDLNGDEISGFGEASKLHWDKKSKKYITLPNGTDGLKRAKSRRHESTTSKASKFEVWKRSQKISRLPRVGEIENKAANATTSSIMRRYRHRSEKAPKAPDKKRNDYHKKLKKFEAAKEKRAVAQKGNSGNRELKGIDAVQKARKIKEKRREKNARLPKQRKA